MTTRNKTRGIHDRVVGHVRRTRDEKSDGGRGSTLRGPRDGITDHGASLAYLHSSRSAADDVIAAYNPGGYNSCPAKLGSNHGIVLNNPRGNYPSRAPVDNTQALDNRAVAAETYAGADKGDRPVPHGDPIHTTGPYRCRKVQGVEGRSPDSETGEVDSDKAGGNLQAGATGSRREGEIVNEFIRARLTDSLAFLDSIGPPRAFCASAPGERIIAPRVSTIGKTAFCSIFRGFGQLSAATSTVSLV